MPGRTNKEALQSPIDSLLAKVVTGTALDETIGETGYLHLDRLHPYLCIHRRLTEEAHGIYRLLAGMGALFILPSKTDDMNEATSWIHHIAAMMVDRFGAFLIVEVWPRKTIVPADSTKKNITFHIRTSAQNVENSAIQTLEEALLGQNWHGFMPHCKISFEPTPAPDGFESLVSIINVDCKRRFYIGLEIDAIYLEPDTGLIRPDVLRAIGTDFSHCLKQAIFAFAKSKSTKKPEHYQQLGTQVVTEATVQSDLILNKIGKSIDLVFYATPVNTTQAWQQFQKHAYNIQPEFHYRPLTTYQGHLKRNLYNAPVDEIEDPALHFIFAERRTELDRQINMLGDRGSVDFLLGSQQIYPWPGDTLLDTAKALISALDPTDSKTESSDYLSAEQFAMRAQSLLQEIGEKNTLKAVVEIRDDMPGIMVSDGNLLIGSEAKFSQQRVNAVLNHEIGTHIVTHHNGAAQPFCSLQVGFAGYQPLQEGLAVVAEYLTGGLDHNRIRQIAGRVIAVHSVIDGALFMDTFRLLHEVYDFDPHPAFITTMRAHRSGGFTKDTVYLQGIIEVLQLLADGHELENLLIGKFATSHVEIIEELRWREILLPPDITPPYLKESSVRQKLKALAEGRTVFHLLKEGKWN